MKKNREDIGEEEFSAGYLSQAMKRYVEENGMYTQTGAVDYQRVAEAFGTNHSTIRQAMAGEGFNPRWETWNRLIEKLGKKVVVKKKE